MFHYTNGFDKETFANQKKSRLRRRSKKPEVYENSESPLAGFTKTPIVVLSRLNGSCSYGMDRSFQKERQVRQCLEFKLKDCSVTLVRNDLNKLKELFKPNGIGRNSCSVTMFQCIFCNKVYNNESKLQNHLQNKHVIVEVPKNRVKKRVSFSQKVIVHQLVKKHACRRCSKMFSSYDKLKIHMKVTHKKRRFYICYYCNKSFVDRMFFKIHIKLHCDACGKLFPAKPDYTRHRNSECKILKKYKCRTCNDCYFNMTDLKDHSYVHLGTFFNCNTCKYQFDTKCCLAYHTSVAHMKIEYPELYETRCLGSEKLYICNYCDESFIDKQHIEKHVDLLAKIREVVKYFDCDQCLKKFNIEKDMLQHKWTHYLNPGSADTEKPSDSTETNGSKLKSFNIHQVPEYLKPQVLLVKLKDSDIPKRVENLESNNQNVSPEAKGQKPQKKYKYKHKLKQCPDCGKVLCGSSSLKRHIFAFHTGPTDLRCKICEETFAWPSLLRTHKCLRSTVQEFTYENIFNPINDFGMPNQEDDEVISIDDDDDYEDDFELPEPIVELLEYQDSYIDPSGDCFDKQPQPLNQLCILPFTKNGYSIVQEVPIEF